MPQKKHRPKPVAKKKRQKEIQKAFSKKEQVVTEKQIKKGIADLERRMDERADYANLILASQSAAVKRIVDQMVETMWYMVGENPPVYFNGTPITLNDWAVTKRLYEKQFHYIAARLLVALAVWDIRLENFTLPAELCAKCGLEVEV